MAALDQMGAVDRARVRGERQIEEWRDRLLAARPANTPPHPPPHNRTPTHAAILTEAMPPAPRPVIRPGTHPSRG